MYIARSKQEMRKLHWQEILNRVTTHEGEMLAGDQGAQYKQKYSKRYLGKDLTAPVNFEAPQYQKELAKTK